MNLYGDQGAHKNIHGFRLFSLNIRFCISEKGSAISSNFGFMISTIDLRFLRNPQLETTNFVVLCACDCYSHVDA